MKASELSSHILRAALFEEMKVPLLFFLFDRIQNGPGLEDSGVYSS